MLPPGFALQGDQPKVPEGFSLVQEPGLLSRIGSAVSNYVKDRAQELGQNYKTETDTINAVPHPLSSQDPRAVALRDRLSKAAMGVAAPAEALGAAAKGVAAPASVVGRVLPGATRRAEEKISDLGPSLDKDEIGKQVLTSLRPNYDALHATRGAELARVAQMEDGPARTAAFRKVYNDPKYAELKKFEESPLGQKVIADTTKYSNAPKINPKSFLNQAFKSPQDVRDLKELFNGDQVAVESVARRYVSSELKEILDVAKAPAATEANPLKSEAGSVATNLIRWRAQNSDWLKLVPETEKAVNTFIDNVFAVAKTQKQFKYAASAAAALGLTEAGFHPFGLFSRLFGGVE